MSDTIVAAIVGGLVGGAVAFSFGWFTGYSWGRKYMERYIRLYDIPCGRKITTNFAYRSQIDSMPTIIPAEKGEESCT